MKPAGDALPRGYLSEIFCSVQGEGLYVGERQVFMRTAGCDASCHWCDTPAGRTESPRCRIQGAKTRSIENPVTVEQAVQEILSLIRENEPVRAVSITGGEPLEQCDFVAEVARSLKHQNHRVYLETSGLEVDGLKRVRPYADVVAMDIKLPSATGKEHWDTHREFLKWLVGREAFVKIVVEPATPLDEIVEAIHLIAEVDRSFPLVLQPESSAFLGKARQPESRSALTRLLGEGQRIGLNSLRDVRIIPQFHKILGVR